MRDPLPRSDRRPALVVIGVGNALRGDDAVGLEVVRRLPDLGDHVSVHALEGDCISLLDRWAGADTALIVDAARSGRPAGSITERDASEAALPVGLNLRSSHAFGVAEAIELARALARLPQSVLVYAIEGRSFAYGDELTPAVAAAGAKVADRIDERAQTIREAMSTSRVE